MTYEIKMALTDEEADELMEEIENDIIELEKETNNTKLNEIVDKLKRRFENLEHYIEILRDVE